MLFPQTANEHSMSSLKSSRAEASVGNRPTQVPALPLQGCVSLDQALSLSGPQFPICWWVGGLNKIMSKAQLGPSPE